MKRRTVATLLAATLLAAAPWAYAGDAAPGGVTVRDAWARATPPGAAVAAAYLTIVGGAAPDRLVSVRTEVAAMAQVHEVTESGGMTRMREAGEVEIPAGAVVVLAPQGLHLMLMNLRQPLVAGEHFKVTLEFAHAGPREVDVAVVEPGQSLPAAH